MRKTIKFNILWKCTLAILLTFASVTTLISAEEMNVSDTFDVREKVSFDMNMKHANISFEIDKVDEMYQITEVRNPDDSVQDLINNSGYTVSENGTYRFTVLYYNQSDEEHTYTKEVKIEGIASVKEEDTTQINQRTIVNDNGVTITIPKYNDVQGWNNGDIKEVEVLFDFGGNSTTSNKQLIINLPEGLRFVQIPTAGTVTPIKGTDSNVLQPLDELDPLYKGILSTQVPLKESNSMGATFGGLVYNFSPDTRGGTIHLKVRVDATRYYAPKLLESPISAQLYMGLPKQDLGFVTQNIQAVGNPVSMQDGSLAQYSTTGTTTSILAGSASEESVGQAYNYILKVYEDTMESTGTTRSYVKNAKYYIYYPQGTSFKEVSYPNGLGPNKVKSITDDPVNSRVILEMETWSTMFLHAVKYVVPEGLAEGTYTNPEMDYVEYEYYDGATRMKVGNKAKYSVKVKNPSEVVNTMDLTGLDSTTENSIPDVFGYYPNLSIKNSTVGKKTNQTYHFVVDNHDWMVSRVHIPFDASLPGSISNIRYKTNKNQTERIYTPASMSDFGNVSTAIRSLSKEQVGLDTDEFFTEVTAHVGDFSTTYSTAVSKPGSEVQMSTYGTLASNSNGANVTIQLFDTDNPNVKSVITRNIRSVGVNERTMTYGGTAIFINEEGTTTKNVIAGKAFTMKATLALNSNANKYGTTKVMVNPDIYIRQPKGMTVAIDTLKLKDQANDDLEGWSWSTYINDIGETIYKIRTADSVVGKYFGEEGESRSIVAEYDVMTDVRLVGDFENKDLISWSKQGYEVHGQNKAQPYIDIYDMNNDQSKADSLFSFLSNTLVVRENKAVLVETFLALEGKGTLPGYVEGNNSTVAYFTPGTNAEYHLKVVNNSPSPATGLDTYVPIPKTDENFGSKFQSADFKWDMKLNGPVTNIPAGFEVSYSSDANANNFMKPATEGGATYSTNPPSTSEEYDAIKMVKISAIQQLNIGVGAEFKVPLKVNEQMPSAESKIATRNIYSPVYDIKSDSYSGTLSGTKVGAELVISEIGGTVFIDANADGLYDQSLGDTPIENHEVRLFRKKADGTYESVLKNSEQVSVKTDADGVYLFNHNQDLGYDTYAVQFAELPEAGYQYTLHNPSYRERDSDAIIAVDMPNVGDNYKGWVLDINATKPVAKTIGAGFLAYNPATDLKAKINTTPNRVIVGESIHVGSTVEPIFWDNIQHATTPYTWSFVNAEDNAKATLVSNSDGSVTITPQALASGTTTFQMKLVVMDMYGNTNVVIPEATITIISNTPPTITVDTLNVYVGDTVDLVTGVSAVDNTNSSISAVWTGVNANASVTSNTPREDGKYSTAGTFEETYTFKDGNGITGTKKRLVKVNGKPSLTVYGQVYTVGDSNIQSSVDTAATSSYLKAPDMVGEAVDTPLTTAISITGGSVDFSTVGIYEVTYTARTIDNKEITKVVKVLVQPKKTIIANNQHIDANGFLVENTDANNLSEAIVKNIAHGNVRAYKVERDGLGNIIDIFEMTNNVQVNATQLQAIQNSTSKGGLYKLTFASQGVSVDVDVFVKSKNGKVSMDGSLFLDASLFEVNYNRAVTLDLEQAKGFAEVSAVEMSIDSDGYISFENLLEEVLLSDTELVEINNVSTRGGIYSLNFNVSGASDTLNKTIETLVHPVGGVSDLTNSLLISGEGFKLTLDEANNLDETMAKQLGNLSAYSIERDGEANPVSFADITSIIQTNRDDIQAINNVSEDGGIYSITFTIADSGKFVTKKIMVVVEGDETSPIVVTPTGDYLVMYSNNAIIKYSEAINATKDSIFAVTNARAYLVKAGTEVQVNFSDEDLESMKRVAREGGTYEIELSASSENPKLRAGVTVSSRVKVTVLKDEISHASKNTNNSGVNTNDSTNTLLLIAMLAVSAFVVTRRKLIKLEK